jgi:hypothetical protein
MHRSHVHKVLGKLNERALYVKSQRAGSKQRKLSSLVMLFNLDKSRRTRSGRKRVIGTNGLIMQRLQNSRN